MIGLFTFNFLGLCDGVLVGFAFPFLSGLDVFVLVFGL